MPSRDRHFWQPMALTDTPLEFIGSSRNDLSDFPDDVKRCIGLAP
jgi:phage-related protein